MVTANLNQEWEMDYEVSYRELHSHNSHGSQQNVTSRERYHTQAYYSRGGKGRIVNGAHRRREKRNYW